MPTDFTPEDELEIDKSAEARHRAWLKNRAVEKKEAADAACAAGNHASFKDEKCVNCGADKPKETPQKKKSLLA
jgi:hypothetical protein